MTIYWVIFGIGVLVLAVGFGLIYYMYSIADTEQPVDLPLAVKPAVDQPPALEPPALEPPTLEPPTSQPPELKEQPTTKPTEEPKPSNCDPIPQALVDAGAYCDEKTGIITLPGTPIMPSSQSVAVTPIVLDPGVTIYKPTPLQINIPMLSGSQRDYINEIKIKSYKDTTIPANWIYPIGHAELVEKIQSLPQLSKFPKEQRLCAAGLAYIEGRYPHLRIKGEKGFSAKDTFLYKCFVSSERDQVNYVHKGMAQDILMKHVPNTTIQVVDPL